MTAGSITLNAGTGGENVATDETGGVAYQRVKLVDGAIDGTDAISGDATNGLDVDVTRIVPGTGATNLGKAEDAVHTTGDVGVMTLGVRQDTQADFGADGDYVPMSIDADGAVRVNAINAGGTATDDAAFTVASDTVAVMGALADETTPDSVDEGDVGAVRMTLARELKVQPNDFLTPAGDSMVDDTNDALQVNIVAGTAGATEYTEDAAAPANPVGTASLMERDDALAGLTPIEGDWSHQFCTAEGALWVQDFNSDAILADTANIDTNITTIAGTVSGSELQCDIVSAALPTGAATAANQSTANTSLGNIETAVQLIDNSIFADDAAFTLGGSSVNMAGAIRDDTLSALTAIEGDAVPLRVNSTGALHVTGAGGGTQYNVDDAAGATDTGTLALAIRDDALTTLTPADGDYVGLRVSSTGALHVTGGGGGTEYTQDAAATDPATAATTLLVRDDALATQETADGDWTVPRANARGAQWVQLDQNGVDITIADGGNTITVDGTVDLGATDNAVLDQIEVNTSYGDNTGGGAEAGALRVTLANDSTGLVSVDDNGGSLTVDGTVTANLGATDNAVLDQIELNTSYGDNTGNGTAAGALRVTVASDTTGVLSIDDNGGSITVDGTVTADLGANNDVTVTGGNAHDGTTLGNPVLGGARATNSVEGITQVANADLTHIQADLNGVLLSRPHTTLEEIISERAVVSTSASTALTTFGAGGAGIHNYITTISVANTTGTQGLIDISNGSASAAGLMWSTIAVASGGSNISFDPPLRQPTANAPIHIKTDVSVDAIYVSLNGFQAQG